MAHTVIIGHGKTPVGKGWGPKIDACDVVVRMWDNHWQDVPDWGTKYDYGYFEISPKQFQRYMIWTERLGAEAKVPVKGWVGGLLKGTEHPLPPKTKVIKLGDWIYLGLRLGGVGTTGKLKLTRGCAAAAWAINTFGGEVTLVGFDNVYFRRALTPEEGFPDAYRAAGSTALFKNYVGGGTKFHNHDYIAEGDILMTLAERAKADLKHAQDRWAT